VRVGWGSPRKSDLAGAKDWAEFVKTEEKAKRDEPILARIERRAQIYVELMKEPDVVLERRAAAAKAEWENLERERERRAQSPIPLNVSAARVAQKLASTNEELFSAASKALEAATLRDWRLRAQRKLDSVKRDVEACELNNGLEGLRPIYDRANLRRAPATTP